MTKGVELRPAGRKYPSVVVTVEELLDLLKLIETEFEWNKEWEEHFPNLNSVAAKLELFEYELVMK
jgi:hypothetical protein